MDVVAVLCNAYVVAGSVLDLVGVFCKYHRIPIIKFKDNGVRPIIYTFPRCFVVGFRCGFCRVHLVTLCRNKHLFYLWGVFAFR